MFEFSLVEGLPGRILADSPWSKLDVVGLSLRGSGEPPRSESGLREPSAELKLAKAALKPTCSGCCTPSGTIPSL